MTVTVWKDKGLWHARVPESGLLMTDQTAARQAIRTALSARDLLPLDAVEIPLTAVEQGEGHTIWRTTEKYGTVSPGRDDFYPGQHMEIVACSPRLRHYFVIGDVVEYVEDRSDMERHMLRGHTERRGSVSGRSEYPETQYLRREDFIPTTRGLTDRWGDEVEDNEDDSSW